MHQLALDFDERPEPAQRAPKASRERLSIQERFEAFHAAHPDVFELFVRFAREAKANGKERFGAKAIFERMRWHYQTSSTETPKLNNIFTAGYARIAMERCPDLAGFFETRELKRAKRGD